MRIDAGYRGSYPSFRAAEGASLAGPASDPNTKRPSRCRKRCQREERRRDVKTRDIDISRLFAASIRFSRLFRHASATSAALSPAQIISASTSSDERDASVRNDETQRQFGDSRTARCPLKALAILSCTSRCLGFKTEKFKAKGLCLSLWLARERPGSAL